MKIYEIVKASPIGKDSSAVDIMIRITGEVPEFNTLHEGEEFFTLQAMQISEALFNSLPQGTMDRLLAEMMKRKASLYVGLSK